MAAAALDGLSVVELAEGVAGPYCGRLLAAFGAEVVKVEIPRSGDWTRRTRPLLPDVPEPEGSALFLYLNTGKKSVLLDWRDQENRATLHRILGRADIVVDSSRPGELNDLGLGFDRIGRHHPNLIMVSVTDFGNFGPYRNWTSTPLVNLALGGYLYLSGDEHREPLMLPGYQADYLAGLHGFLGATIALWSRDESGRGQHVDVGKMESLAALHQFTTVMHTYRDVVRSRHGNRFEEKGGYGRYPITMLPCKDGYVSFAVSIEHQWEHMCAMIGRKDLLEDPGFATFEDRRARADEVDAILIDWMKDRTKAEVFEEAAGVWSVPVAPVAGLREVLADPQYQHRGLWTTFNHPAAGELTYPTLPVAMSATQPNFGRAPTLGEHDAEVFRFDDRARTKVESRCEIRNLDRDQPNVEPRQPELALGIGRARRGGPLSDTRILDLTRVWSGPLALRMLADFGAEVIKVSDPRVPVDRTSGTNNKLNRNKIGVALRLDRPEGRETFLNLVNVSDVVVENFRPRVMRNFNLDYDALREVKPDVIMCSMPGFGTEGTYADYPAFGPSVETMTGITSLMGYRCGPPMVSSIAYPDPLAGMNAVGAIMSALRHRRMTGEGQFIDVALSEGPVCQIGEELVAFSRTGQQPPRIGNSHPDHAPYGVYPAAGEDEWIAICVTSDDQWGILTSVLANGSAPTDQRFASTESRVAQRVEVDRLVGGWTAKRDARELTRTLQARGIAAGAALKNWQLLEDQHLNQRGFITEIDEPGLGIKRYPGQAIHMSTCPAANYNPSPRLGEHSREVLKELLTMPDDKIDSLANDGTVGLMDD